MKRTPIKGLANFFSSLGKQARAGQKDRGIFSEKGKAEKADRKPGESKFKADVRRRKREANKSSKAGQKAIKTINKDFKKDVNSPTNTKPGELKVNKELMSKKVNKPESKQTFKQAFAAARKAGKKTFSFKGKPYTTKLAEKKNPPPDIIEKEKILQAVPRVNREENLIKDKKITEENNFNFDKTNDYSYSPVNKKSPSKKRGYKMKRK